MQKATMLFNYTSGLGRAGGWSETWYYDGAPADTLGRLRTLARARAQMMPRSIKILGGRIAEVLDVKKNTTRGFGVDLNFPGAQTRIQQDIPQMALLCSIQTTTGQNIKRFTLRGIPDIDVVDGDYSPTSAIQGAFDAFAVTLGDDRWQFRISSAGTGINIISIGANGAYRLAADLGVVADQEIVVNRCKNTDGKNVSGRFFVGAVTDARNGTLLGWNGGVVNQKGTMRIVAYGFALVNKDSCKIIRTVTRKVGRPSVVYRGRAQRKR